MMSHRLRSSWLSILALIFLVPLGACNCNGTSSNSADKDSKGSKAEPAAVAPDDKEEAKDAPPADLYPGMQFGALEPKERIKFVEIAKSEVCPCPDAAESLHECLQEEASACGLAKQVAMMTAMGIRQGYNETDILTKIAEFTEAAKKQYDFQLNDVPHKGPEDAPVVLVEFADFQCPHCKEAASVLDEVVAKHGDDVVYYFKNFPLSAHTNSQLAARAALAAGEQGKFWEMHDLLFKHQRSLSRDKIVGFARRLGLNMSKFEKDLKDPDIARQVQRDLQEAKEANLTGTPALFINGTRYLGPKTTPAISQAVAAEVEEAKGAEGGEAEQGAEKAE